MSKEKPVHASDPEHGDSVSGDPNKAEDQNKAEDPKKAEDPMEDREIVYYYSREHRLRRASAAVRELNNTSRPGAIKAIAGHRANLLLLVSILIVCVAILMSSRFSGRSSTGFGMGNNTLSVFAEEEAAGFCLYIQKTIPAGKEVYTGAVDIAISPARPKGGGEAPIYTDRIYFSLVSPEYYKFPLPFGGDRFIVILNTEEESVIRTVRIKK